MKHKSLWGLLKPFWLRMLGAALLGAGTIFGNVGLLATSAVLISLAALMPPILDLMVLIVGVRFFGISRALLRYTERYVTHDITLRILSKLRVTLYGIIEPLAPAGLSSYGSGQLLNRLTGDIETLKYFYLRAVSTPLVAVLVLAISSVFLWQFNPKAALVLIGLMVLGGVIMPIFIRLRSRKLTRRYGVEKEGLQNRLMDYLEGLAELESAGCVKEKAQEIGESFKRLEGENKKLGAMANLTTNVITYFSNVALWLSLVVTIPLVSSGELSGIFLAMVILVVWASFEAVIPIPQAIIQVEQSLVAADHIFGLGEHEKTKSADPGRGATPMGYHLVLEGVDFAYQAGEALLYQNLSLKIPAGAKVAIVGSSGSGKSTLINLLLNFWQPRAGQITLGGQALGDLEGAVLRSCIGVVSQSAYLFNTSIRENLLLAKPEATEVELLTALSWAMLMDDLAMWPKGLDTFVGENGMKLSGGQRQRVALARLFLQDSPIVILDEATQGLDTLTSQRILAHIQEWSLDKTVIHITHSLKGLGGMDCIYVFAHGEIVEQGKERDLLEQGGIYQHMWHLERAQV